MTLLRIMPDHDADQVLLDTGDPEWIAEALAPYGVDFTRWAVRPGLDRAGGSDAVLGHFAEEVAALRAQRGFTLVDVATLTPDPDDPARVEGAKQAREKFLDEHQHDEDEVRFFVAGRGCFYLHLDGHVLAVVCEEGDLLSVPAGTTHWFDMGETPDFTAIRFFEREDGWIGDFTGDSISSRFPTIDDLVAGR